MPFPHVDTIVRNNEKIWIKQLKSTIEVMQIFDLEYTDGFHMRQKTLDRVILQLTQQGYTAEEHEGCRTNELGKKERYTFLRVSSKHL